MKNRFEDKQIRMKEVYKKKINRRGLAARVPKIDFFESQTTYYIRISLPGVRREDVKINFPDDNTVVINGMVLLPEIEKEYQKTINQEIFQGPFKREFRLISAVDAENVQYHNDNGILSVYLPKKDGVNDGRN